MSTAALPTPNLSFSNPIDPTPGTGRQRSHIIQNSDEHIPFPNSDAVAAYEMLYTTRPRGLVHAGDRFQLEPDKTAPRGVTRGVFPMTMAWLCYLDLPNQLQARGEMDWELYLYGNHDIRLAQDDVTARGRAAGINIAPGVLYGDEGFGAHSHQNDSDYVNDFLNAICSTQSATLVSQSADAFAIGHHVSKTFLAAQDYRPSFTGTTWKFGVSTYNKGHDHDPREVLIYDPPFASLGERGVFKRLRNAAFLAAVPVLKVVLPPVVHGMGSSVYQGRIAPAITRAFNGVTVKAALRSVFGARAVQISDLVASATLKLTAARPDLGILDHVHVERMRPPEQAHVFDGSKKILGITRIVSSAWTEGLNSYQDIDGNGRATLKRWDAPTRAGYGLPELAPTEEEIVARHFAEFGGFHPRTLEQLEFYLDGNDGLLGDPSPETVRTHSRMPAPQDVWRIHSDRATGRPSLVLPKGLTVQRASPAEAIAPRRLAAFLACLDPRIAFDAGDAQTTRDFDYDFDEEEDAPAGIGPPVFAPGWS